MIHIEKNEAGVHIVKPLAANLDYSSAPELARELLQLIDQGAGSIILDLDGVNFIDSSGLTAILKAQSSLITGNELVVCRTQSRVASAFKLSRIDQTVTQARDVAQALALLDRA